MIDMANRPFFRQHEPLPTPDKWDDSERRFAHKLEQLLDELFQLGTKLRLLLRGEKVGDYGLSQNSYTDAEKEKLENIETLAVPVPIEKGGTGQTSVAAARNAFGLGNTDGPLPIANGGTGEADITSARKAFGIVKTNANDDSVAVNVNDNDTVYIRHVFNGDIIDVNGNDTGVYVHRRTSGTWETIPNAISIGGTGATSADNARINLGLTYKANNTETTAVNGAYGGYVTSNTTEVYFNVTVSKSLENITSISVTSLVGLCRGIDGYIDGVTSSSTNWVGRSGITVSASKVNNYTVRILIKKSSALTNATNNTPAAFNGHYTLKFA